MVNYHIVQYNKKFFKLMITGPGIEVDGAEVFAKSCLDTRKIRGSGNVWYFPKDAALNYGPLRSLGSVTFGDGVIEECKVLRQKYERRKSALISLRKMFLQEGDIPWRYKCRGPFEPLRHQKIMYGAIMLFDSVGILSEAGTCKTASYLWAIDERIRTGVIKRCLVITLSGLKKNVVAEAELQTPGLRCIAVKDTKHLIKVMAEIDQYDVVVSNYEAQIHYGDVMRPEEFDMVVLDEAHRVGDPKSEQTKQIKTWFDNADYRVIVTGSLNANNELSFYVPYRFIGPACVPYSNFYGFRAEYMRPVDNEQRIWVARPHTRAVVAQCIADAGIGFKKESCLDLPGVVDEIRSCEMDADQKKMYKELKKDLVTVFDEMCAKCSGTNFGKRKCNRQCDQTITVDTALILIGKLRQISCGFYIKTMNRIDDDGSKINDSQTISVGKNPKIKLMHNVIAEIPQHEKIIIWTHWTWSIKAIEAELKKRNDGGVIAVHGSVDAFDAVERFKLPGNKYFLAMPSKAGVGLNIQFSSYQIWFSNYYSYLQYDQARSRQDRQGQLNKVTCYHLLCEDSIDYDIMDTIRHKAELDGLLSQTAVMRKRWLGE